MNLWAALLVSSALAALALWRRALTPGGTLLAWALCVVISRIGGWSAFAVLTTTLIFTVLADRVGGKRADPHAIRRKSGSRDAARVLCNVGIGTGAIILSRVTLLPVFALAYVAVMAESLADSMASKLGPLSKKPPVDICTLQPVVTGLSGGVSLMGTAAELLGAGLIGLVYGVFTGDYRSGALCAAIGFAGAIADSVLGSRLQVKYCCRVCGALTEREAHCGKTTKRVRGISAVNNDVVNLLSNLFSFLVAIIAF